MQASPPLIPVAALTEESLGVLERLGTSGERVVVHYNSEAKTLPDANGANVIGELTGSEKPEEVVVISGHLDSWDVGQGAHDDASGYIGPLQALILLKQLGHRKKMAPVEAWPTAISSRINSRTMSSQSKWMAARSG